MRLLARGAHTKTKTKRGNGRKRKFKFQQYGSVTDIEKAVASYCDKNKIRYALTGFSGAARIAPAVRYKKAMIFASDLKEEAFSKLALNTVKSGGNLLLFYPYDDGVFYKTSEIDDIQVTSDIQLYLDLQGFRGRGEEAADVLFERIIGKKW